MMRMQRLRIVQVYSGMAVVMASSLLPLALGVELAGSPAGAATPPLCRTSQLSVSVAPSYTNLHSGNLLVNITLGPSTLPLAMTSLPTCLTFHQLC
jgi:hypothetical protein